VTATASAECLPASVKKPQEIPAKDITLKPSKGDPFTPRATNITKPQKALISPPHSTDVKLLPSTKDITIIAIYTDASNMKAPMPASK